MATLLADDLIRGLNFAEGILWLVIAAGFAVALLWPGARPGKVVAAVNFAAFGVSDFVEMRTGTWAEPWWLAAWKVACVGVMAVQLFLYTKQQNARRRAEKAAGGRPAGRTEA